MSIEKFFFRRSLLEHGSYGFLGALIRAKFSQLLFLLPLRRRIWSLNNLNSSGILVWVCYIEGLLDFIPLGFNFPFGNTKKLFLSFAEWKRSFLLGKSYLLSSYYRLKFLFFEGPISFERLFLSLLIKSDYSCWLFFVI